MITKIKALPRNILLVTVVAILMLSLVITGVNAQEEGGTGSGLSISPTRTELSLLPGTTDSVTVSLRNITAGPVVAKVFVNDFEPDNVTGEPRLVTDPERRNAASISQFLAETPDVVLAVGESKDVTIEVSIPNDAAPGGYYGAVRFQAVPAGEDDANEARQESSDVSLTANLLSLVLIEVPGDITQSVSVNSVKAFLNDNSGSIFTQKPNFLGVEVQNQGNSFIKPFGRVTVTDFGGDEIFGYELNDSNPRSNVLPESTRVFTDAFVNIETRTVNGVEEEDRNSPITSPGRYTVSADISYGNGGEIFTVTSTFWYIPSWLIITLAIVLLLIIAAAVLAYRKYSTRSTRRRK